MRRHAEGWGIRILLGFISLSFVLFFGYSALQDTQFGEDIVAAVGDKQIYRKEYNRAYDAAYSRMQENFKDGVPDNFTKFLRANVLEQLVQRKIQRLFASAIDLRVSDQELAQFIRQQKQFQSDGIFDVQGYKTKFRPYYKRQFGIDFEEALREDLLLDLFNSLKQKSLLGSPLESKQRNQMNQSEWTFQVITVPQAKGKKEIAEKTNQERETTVLEWIKKWPTDDISKKELKSADAILEKSVVVDFKTRNKLIKRALPEEFIKPIFSMTQAQSVYPEPILLNKHWYLLKLLNKTPKATETNDELDGLSGQEINEFLVLWLDEFRKNTNIAKNISL